MAMKVEVVTQTPVCANAVANAVGYETVSSSEVSSSEVSLSERQLCLRDAASLRKQCENMSSASDTAEDKLACPVRREMHRLLKISSEM